MMSSTKSEFVTADAPGELRKLAMVFMGLSATTILAVVNPLLGIGMLALLALGVVLRNNLRMAVLVFVSLIPFDPQFEVTTGRFVSLDLVFAAIAVPLLWRAMGSNDRNNKINRLSFFLAPYLIFVVATTAWRAENVFWFWGSCIRLLIVVFFAAGVSCLDTAESAVIPLGLALPPLALYGLYQLWIEDFGPLYNLLNPHHEDQPWFGRAYSLLLHPNAFGGFCVVVSVILVAFAVRTKSQKLRLLALLSAASGFLGAMCSGSRGSWIAAVAGLVTIFALARVRLRTKAFVLSILLVLVLLASALPSLPLQRGESLDDFTVQTRTMVYVTAFAVFLQHPLIGAGMTNFQEILPKVIQWNNPIIHAHNIYLQVLAENGLVGFLLYYVPFFYLLYTNLKFARDSTTALMASTGLIAVAVHGFFDDLLYSNPQYLFLVAVVFGLALNARFNAGVNSNRVTSGTL